MKRTLFIAVLFAIVQSAAAQNTEPKFSNLDASPADILYYPLRAANVKKGDNSVPVIKVIYSRPTKKGREVFGVMEKFDAVWRLGANENTEIRFSKAVSMGGKKIPKGTYSLFAIPTKDNWTIIVNSRTDRWGAFSYDQAMDVARITVPVSKPAAPVEAFSMTFTDRPDGANLYMAWDNTQVMVPIQFKK